MKKSATAAEDREPAITPAWSRALGLLDADLLRRGAADRTRRAYATDLRQFAAWASAAQLAPQDAGPRELRRYAATLSERRVAPSTVARKLAALRAMFRALREHGVVTQNPAELVASPRRPRHLPRVLRPDELAALLDRIPAGTPLELRDRALLEVAYGCGLRAEELVRLDTTSVHFDAEELRVEGKGGKTRIVPAGEPALQALTRYLERGRPALRADARGGRAVPLEVRPAALDVRRPAAPGGLDARGGAAGRRLPARAAPLVRDPPAGRRRGPARDPGTARPQQHLDDPDLHSGRVGASAQRLPAQSSAGVATGDMEANVKAVELRDLWRRYKTDDDQRARERLVVAYSPLVKYVAGRMGVGAALARRGGRPDLLRAASA